MKEQNMQRIVGIESKNNHIIHVYDEREIQVGDSMKSNTIVMRNWGINIL